MSTQITERSARRARRAAWIGLLSLSGCLAALGAPELAAQTGASSTPVTPVTPVTPTSSSGPPGSLPEVVVTGNPLGASTDELVRPATVLDGRALDARRAGTLGDTLSGQAGVHATGFGPNASRPVIRGLDGDRIRVMTNGAAVIDASSLSFDHASTVEPLVTERFEILRGAGSLLYGGNAIGGVVNAIDNRIPTAPVDAVGGRFESRGGGAARESAAVGVVEAGNGRIAIHGDASWRDARDLRIPGFARSARQREQDPSSQAQPGGTLPNSFSRGESGALGGSLTWGQGQVGGFVGASASTLRSRYGTPADDSVLVDLNKDSYDLAGEARGLAGPVEALRFRLGYTDYLHHERDKSGGTIHTTFKNRGLDGRLEAQHARIGPLRGVIGAQFGHTNFSALGDEAYVPTTRSRGQALFVHEEWSGDRWKLSAGTRWERANVRSGGDDPAAGQVRFGAPDRRDFSARSLALGGLYRIDARWSAALDLASTQRAPTHYELYANGPHAATGTYEIGDPAAGLERSTSIDLSLRYRSGADRFAVNLYRTRFSNYLLLAPTGRWRAEDGSLEDPATPGLTTSGEAADLPEYLTRQVPASFAGVELTGRWRVLESAGTLDLEGMIDSVRATDRESRAPLPRISPLRVSLALIHQAGPWFTRGELMRVAGQSRVAANETPTAGYTLVNLTLAYRLGGGGPVRWEAFARGSNLGNVEARNHVSLVKEVAPLGARALLLGLRGYF